MIKRNLFKYTKGVALTLGLSLCLTGCGKKENEETTTPTPEVIVEESSDVNKEDDSPNEELVEEEDSTEIVDAMNTAEVIKLPESRVRTLEYVTFEDAEDRKNGVVNFDNEVFNKEITEEMFYKIADCGEPGLYTPEGQIYLSWEELIALDDMTYEYNQLNIGVSLPGILKVNEPVNIFDNMDSTVDSKLQGIILGENTLSINGSFNCPNLKYIESFSREPLSGAGNLYRSIKKNIGESDTPYFIGTTLIDASMLSGDVALGEGITCVGEEAFRGSDITSIRTSYSTQIISNDAFSGCVSLKNVTLNSGLSRIGASAFKGTSISSLDIPITVSVLEAGVIEDTPLFYSLLEKEDSLVYFNDFLVALNGVGEVVVPDNTVINSRGIYVADSIDSIVFGSGVHICSGAFFGLGNISNEKDVKPLNITIGADCVLDGISIRYSTLGEVFVDESATVDQYSFAGSTIDDLVYEGEDKNYPWGAKVSK